MPDQKSIPRHATDGDVPVSAVLYTTGDANGTARVSDTNDGRMLIRLSDSAHMFVDLDGWRALNALVEKHVESRPVVAAVPA